MVWASLECSDSYNCVSLVETLETISMELLKEMLALWGHEAFRLQCLSSVTLAFFHVTSPRAS